MKPYEPASKLIPRTVFKVPLSTICFDVQLHNAKCRSHKLLALNEGTVAHDATRDQGC